MSHFYITMLSVTFLYCYAECHISTLLCWASHLYIVMLKDTFLHCYAGCHIFILLCLMSHFYIVMLSVTFYSVRLGVVMLIIWRRHFLLKKVKGHSSKASHEALSLVIFRNNFVVDVAFDWIIGSTNWRDYSAGKIGVVLWTKHSTIISHISPVFLSGRSITWPQTTWPCERLVGAVVGCCYIITIFWYKYVTCQIGKLWTFGKNDNLSFEKAFRCTKIHVCWARLIHSRDHMLVNVSKLF